MEEFRAALGAAVRRRRRALGWSQEQFGGSCGLDRTYVSGIEAGRRNPTLRVLLQMSLALGVPLSALLRQAEEVIGDDVPVQ